MVHNLWQYQTHTPHPRYFGLFNPAPTTMGIAADTLVAAFNPQLAAWSHSPLSIEIEQHVIRLLGARFGYDPASTDGAFTSGGAEARDLPPVQSGPIPTLMSEAPTSEGGENRCPHSPR